MASVKKNIIANFAGSGWTALANIAFIPIYIRFVGIEAYGLIGFFATLQGLCVLLDMGLSASINRELARLSVLPDKKQEMCELTRTLELLYWGLSCAIMLTVVAFAPLIADKWLNGKGLDNRVIRECVILMGIGLFFRWPLGFYQGGLMGLQRQVAFNSIKVIFETFRSVGVILVLWLVAPTIQMFFVWQIAVGCGYTLSLVLIMWRSLGTGIFSSKPNLSLLYNLKRFAAGMSGISLTVVVLTQMDKIILSKMLTLKEFGYYALASTVATGLYQIISPVFYAIYPRFTQLVAMDDRSGLERMYHAGSQLMSLLLLPVSTCIVFFPKEILFLWTRNAETSNNTYLLLSILVAGTAMNGLMNMPYGLQLAYGLTRLTLVSNLVSIAVLGPLIVLMSRQFGAVGAASSWFALNLGYVTIVPHIMHRNILVGEKWRWYRDDVIKPLIVSFSLALLARLLLPDFSSSLLTAASITFLILCSLTLTAASLSLVRTWLLGKYVSFRCA